ncbi:Hypothetical predicted protein [Mytilus galloprovincialis]|uniref:Band 7 domain-containing protein n=1 Tax=Mytilus galloprovincialis TaxID=29158 RepID=A0A8B6CV33_MYTGA|nr:Hypothetical predicted protein [Mytilus galloprovincialis]
MSSGVIKVIVSIVAAILGLISILIIASYSYLDYYEYGLKRQKSTGSVDKTEVYDGGRYFIGPDFEFKIFPADLHEVDIDNAKVFSSDKLEVQFSAHFQYVIRKNELVSLHDAYDLGYKEVMKSSALDAVKGAITVYNVRELINNRSEIEQTVWKSVRERLGGTCCNSYCDQTNPLCTNCVTVCSRSHRGLNVEVKYFQLGKIKIPSEVENQFIRASTLKEQNDEEKLKQKAVIVRKETNQKVAEIENEAKEISQNATAQAALVQSIARANYTALLETARSEGLKLVFSSLNITQQDKKNSFDYLRTIRGLDKLHLTVDYQQRIAGNLG